MNVTHSLAAGLAIPAAVSIGAEPPTFLNWNLVIPFVLFLILVAACVVFIPQLFSARRHDVTKQASVAGSFAVPAIVLVVILTGLAFSVINYFAGWFVLGA